MSWPPLHLLARFCGFSITYIYIYIFANNLSVAVKVAHINEGKLKETLTLATQKALSKAHYKQTEEIFPPVVFLPLILNILCNFRKQTTFLYKCG